MTGYVRVAAQVTPPADAAGAPAVRRRPGYEHLDLNDWRQVPVRRSVTTGAGRLIRRTWYVPVGDRLAARQARKARRKGGMA